MAKSFVFLAGLLVSFFAMASRPSPYASYYQPRGQQSWDKVAEVTFTGGNIVTTFLTGCSAVMKPEGEFNYQGTCSVRYSQITYIAQLKLQNFRYVLYFQAVDFGHPDAPSSLTIAYPRY